MKRRTMIQDRYEVVRRLGQGGMGEVLLVNDLVAKDLGESQSQRALKFLQTDSSTEAEAQHPFQQEFLVLSALRHPALVRVFDFGFDARSGRNFYTSEFVDGDDLATAGKDLSIPQKLGILLRIAHALDFLHGKGILHNDLKPSNILLERTSQQPKVLDFGLSQMSSEKPKPGSRGTPTYMAPEVIRGEPATIRSDLFSFGMICFEVLAGQTPHTGRSVRQVLQENLACDFPSLRDQGVSVSAGVNQTVQNLLAKATKDRPSSAGEVVRAFLRAFGEEGLQELTLLERRSFAEGEELLGRRTAVREARDFLVGLIPSLAETMHTLHLSGESLGSFGEPDWKAVARAVHEPDVVLWIVGEAGMGKTALLRHLRSRTQVLGIPVASAVCSENDPALLPWKRVLYELKSVLGALWDRLPVEVIARIEPDSVRAAGLAPERTRENILFELQEVLREAFSRSPFVLAFDDVDRMEPGSKFLLERYLQIASESGQSLFPPTLLTVNSGSFDTQSMGVETRRSRVIRLDSLRLSDTERLLQMIFPGTDLPAALLSAMQNASSGNPLFIRQFACELLESNAVERQAGVWKWSAFEKIKDGEGVLQMLPKSIDRLIDRRLSIVSADSRSLLELIATSNIPLPTQFVSEFCKHQRISKPSELIEQLIRKELLRSDLGDLHLPFEKLRDHLLGPLSAERRVRYERAVLEYLVSRGERYLEEVARLLENQGNESGAFENYLRAANQWKDRYGYERAIYLFARAEQISERQTLEPMQVAEVYLGLGDSFSRIGKTAEAEKAFQKALKIQVDATDEFERKRIQGYRFLGIRFRNLGRYPEALEQLREGLRQITSDKFEKVLHDLRCEIEAQIALTYHRMGEKAKRDNLLGELKLRIEQIRRQEQRLPALFILAGLEVEAGNHAEANRIYQHSYEIACKANRTVAQATALNNLGNLCARSGESEKALEYLQRALEVGRKANDVTRLANTYLSTGKVRYLLGDLRQASSELREGIRLARLLENPSLLASGLLTLSQVSMHRSHYADALGIVEEVEKLENRRPDPGNADPTLEGVLIRCQVLLRSGRAAESIRILRALSKKNPKSSKSGAIQSLIVEALVRSESFNSPELAGESVEAWIRSAKGPEETQERIAVHVQLLLQKRDYEAVRGLLPRLRSGGKDSQSSLQANRILYCRLLGSHPGLSKNPRGLRLLMKSLKDLLQIATEMEQTELVWQIHSLRGRVALDVGDPSQALESFQQASDVISRILADLPSVWRDAFQADHDVSSLQKNIQKLRGSQSVLSQELAEERSFRENLQRLLVINQELARGWQSRHRLLEFILDTSMEFSSAEYGMLILRDSLGSWKIACHQGRGAKKGNHQDFSRSIVEEVASARKVRVILDAGSEKELSTHRSVAHLALRTVIVFPLQVEGQVLGVLYLDFQKILNRVPAEMLELGNALANQAALTLAQMDRQESLNRTIDDVKATLRRTEAELEEKNRDLEWKYSYRNIIGGKDPAMRRVFDLLDRVSATEAAVLIEGESGTGKELIAQAIHYNSARKEKPFVALNCAGLNPTLLESELFGHRRGAFTGADQDREGLFVIANGGTVFLDEIADMPLEVQAKLLRTLQEGEIRPLGSDAVIHVDVRIVSASNQSLEAKVQGGTFRQDFFYRLNVVAIHLPPLRERREDFDALLDHVLAEMNAKRTSPVQLSVQARDALRSYSWPGNVRELRNTVENLIAMSRKKTLTRDDLPEHIREDGGQPIGIKDYDSAKDDFTRAYLERLLRVTDGNVSEAARIARVYRQSLHRMLVRFGLGSGRGSEE